MHTFWTTIILWLLASFFNNPKLNSVYKLKIYNMYVNALTNIQQNLKHKNEFIQYF